MWTRNQPVEFANTRISTGNYALKSPNDREERGRLWKSAGLNVNGCTRNT